MENYLSCSKTFIVPFILLMMIIIPPPVQAQQDDAALEDFARQLTGLFNEARAEGRMCGDEFMPPAPPVAWDEDLRRAARIHSADMSENDFRGHTGSDGSSPTDRVRRVTDRFSGAAEILAYGSNSPQNAVNRWLRSPGHCRIIMGQHYRYMGAHVIRMADRPQQLYWTAKFARSPDPAAYRPQAQTPEEQYLLLRGKQIIIYGSFDDERFNRLRHSVSGGRLNYFPNAIRHAELLQEREQLLSLAGYNRSPEFAVVRIDNLLIIDPPDLNNLIFQYELGLIPIFPDGFEKLSEHRVFIWGEEVCAVCDTLIAQLRLAGTRPVRYYTDRDARTLEHMWSKVEPAAAYEYNLDGTRHVDLPVIEIAGSILTGEVSLQDLLNVLE